MQRFVNLRERGDTIIEVMISIAVVSMMLGGAYVTTNRSLQGTRAAQERSVALKLAESQIERIKALSLSGASLPTGTAAFCMSPETNQPVTLGTNEGGGACAVDSNGNPATGEPIFHISIVRKGDVYELTERWANVNGKGQEQLQLRYRVL